MSNPEPSAPSPIHLPGPTLHDRATQLTILTPSQLRQTNFLPGLYHTINAAFQTSVPTRPTPRLAAATDFLQQLREAPDTFVAVLHYPNDDDDDATVLGTASARRHEWPVASAYGNLVKPQPQPQQGQQEQQEQQGHRPEPSVFTRTTPSAPGTEEWELKLLAVEPQSWKRGVAGWLMGVVEAEVIARFRAKRKDEESKENEGEGGGAGTRLMMVLTTLKETQGGFYARRGYAVTAEKPRGDGLPYHVVFMSKELLPAA